MTIKILIEIEPGDDGEYLRDADSVAGEIRQLAECAREGGVSWGYSVEVTVIEKPQPPLADVPRSIVINGKHCRVVDMMENVHYRALVLLPLGSPRWLSNEEVVKYTGVASADEETLS